jgi:hypothetical protein
MLSLYIVHKWQRDKRMHLPNPKHGMQLTLVIRSASRGDLLLIPMAELLVVEFVQIQLRPVPELQCQVNQRMELLDQQLRQ